MTRNILVINAHPDAGNSHFGDALAEHYASAAKGAGLETRMLILNELQFPLLDSATTWRAPEAPVDIQQAQDDIRWCDHMTFFYPLWMGDLPALLKGFLEQVMRPNFAFTEPQGKMPEKLLTGRSARLVVTMGMPAFFYRAFYRAHSVKSFRRNVLLFSGIRPVRTSLIGMVESSARQRQKWLDKMSAAGRKGH